MKLATQLEILRRCYGHRYIRGTPRYDTWLLSSEKTLSAAGCSIVNSFLNTACQTEDFLWRTCCLRGADIPTLIKMQIPQIDYRYLTLLNSKQGELQKNKRNNVQGFIILNKMICDFTLLHEFLICERLGITIIDIFS